MMQLQTILKQRGYEDFEDFQVCDEELSKIQFQVLQVLRRGVEDFATSKTFRTTNIW